MSCAIRWPALVALVLLLAVFAGCDRDAPAPVLSTGPTIRLAAYYWPGMYWVDIAAAKGWFAEAGLDVRVVDTNPDYYGSLTDVVEGRLDVAGFTLFDQLSQIAAGHDLTAVAVLDVSVGIEKLVGRPGLERLEDLAGRRLGLPRGTYMEYQFETAAHQFGLDPAAVQVVDLAAELAPGALARGEVDAIFTWEPYASQAVAAGGRTLFDSSRIPGLSSSVLALRPEFVRARRADVAAMLRVWHRATQFLHEHPAEAFRIVADTNRQPIEDVARLPQQDRILDLEENYRSFSYPAGFDSLHGSLRRINDFLVDKGRTSRHFNSQAILDPSFVFAMR